MMEMTIKIHDEITGNLGKKKDDLHLYIHAENFRIVEPEIRKAVIAKLMLIDEGRYHA